MDAYTNRLSWEDREALKEEFLVAASEVQADEWMGDWEVVENHVRSGDFTISKMVSELIVAGYRAPRGPSRVRTMEILGELLCQELKESLAKAAQADLERSNG